MRVLVGCERSGVVRRAFRELGHDAWSCDLESADDGSEFHIHGNVLYAIDDGWDLGIFHPDCTYLANSGSKHLWRGMKRENGPDFGRFANMVVAADFFLELLNAPIPHVAVENPIMHGHARMIVGERQAQVVQPWQFGDGETKATALWLKNLPPLEPTSIVDGREARVHRMPPGPDRKRLRSETYPGIAKAMAEQWGSLEKEVRAA
jgi:hypothetical protein